VIFPVVEWSLQCYICSTPVIMTGICWAFQWNLQVCTFRLVLKNAASLLDKDDPLKVNADAALDALIRSFVALDRLLADGAAGATSRRENVMGALKETTVALDSFERGVRNCLGIA
jgi:hypothetical protein